MQRHQGTGARISVLVVEDGKVERDIFKAVLSEAGFEVHTADSFSSALQALVWHWIDVVLIDAAFDGNRGLELTRYLKNLPVYPKDARLPVMVFSREHKNLASDALSAGADEFLWEPGTDALVVPQIVSAAQAA